MKFKSVIISNTGMDAEKIDHLPIYDQNVVRLGDSYEKI